MKTTNKTSIDRYLQEIVERLKPLHPYKIILFGSHASGIAGEDSDIDLYIITNDEFIPENYEQKLDLKLRVARVLREVRKKVALDLVVHTLPMYRKFVESGGYFADEITKRGSLLYENSN